MKGLRYAAPGFIVLIVSAFTLTAVDYFNDDPVVHTWTYKLDKAA
jgi:hypothetical protein